MIELTLSDRVYELALFREPCNEIGTEMLRALERALDEIDPKKGRALVIYSRQKNGFSAGADLRELHGGMLSRPQAEHSPLLKEFLDRVHTVMDRLDLLPLPTVGAIHGVCFGGGFELALTCDLLVADQTARFCFPELRLGILPCFGGIPRLKRELGNCVVRDLLLTGRSINARKAAELGLVSQVVAPGEAVAVARTMARQVAKFDSVTVAEAKAFIKRLPHEELAREKELAIRLFGRPVVLAALQKFVDSTDAHPYLP
ncbi:MAG: enoyl-CoA hydratase/isomerase family protein [Pseudomonadota bacterium]